MVLVTNHGTAKKALLWHRHPKPTTQHRSLRPTPGRAHAGQQGGVSLTRSEGSNLRVGKLDMRTTAGASPSPGCCSRFASSSCGVGRGTYSPPPEAPRPPHVSKSGDRSRGREATKCQRSPPSVHACWRWVLAKVGCSAGLGLGRGAPVSCARPQSRKARPSSHSPRNTNQT